MVRPFKDAFYLVKTSIYRSEEWNTDLTKLSRARSAFTNDADV